MLARSLAVLSPLLLADAAALCDEGPRTFLDATAFDATVDFFVDYNFNDPATHSNKLRGDDGISGNGPQLHLAKLTIDHPPGRGPADWFGFRLDVGSGTAIALLQSSDPATATHPQEVLWHGAFEQAFVSFVVAKARGLRLDVGKFLSPIGFEVPEAREDLNYTRSLLYNFAVPFFHTGLRVTLPIVEGLRVSGSIVNGWNTFVVDGTALRTGTLLVAWTPSDKGSLTASYIFGLTDSKQETFRQVVDLYGVLQPIDPLKLVLDGTFGYDPVLGGQTWFGFALYARYQILRWLATAVRAEIFDDVNGFAIHGVDALGRPVPQLAGEVTATVEGGWDIGQLNLLVRAEYRHDQSSIAFFDGSAGGALLPPAAPLPSCPGADACHHGQDTILLGVIGYWKAH